MYQARPEEQRRPGSRIDVGQVGDDHEGSEGGQIFNHVEMRSLGPLRPGCWRRGVLGISEDGAKSLALIRSSTYGSHRTIQRKALQAK